MQQEDCICFSSNELPFPRHQMPFDLTTSRSHQGLPRGGLYSDPAHVDRDRYGSVRRTSSDQARAVKWWDRKLTLRFMQPRGWSRVRGWRLGTYCTVRAIGSRGPGHPGGHHCDYGASSAVKEREYWCQRLLAFSVLINALTPSGHIKDGQADAVPACPAELMRNWSHSSTL
jgi:hypothetical protein